MNIYSYRALKRPLTEYVSTNIYIWFSQYFSCIVYLKVKTHYELIISKVWKLPLADFYIFAGDVLPGGTDVASKNLSE
jgi:hypothetical protein